MADILKGKSLKKVVKEQEKITPEQEKFKQLLSRRKVEEDDEWNEQFIHVRERPSFYIRKRRY